MHSRCADLQHSYSELQSYEEKALYHSKGCHNDQINCPIFCAEAVLTLMTHRVNHKVSLFFYCSQRKLLFISSSHFYAKSIPISPQREKKADFACVHFPHFKTKKKSKKKTKRKKKKNGSSISHARNAIFMPDKIKRERNDVQTRKEKRFHPVKKRGGGGKRSMANWRNFFFIPEKKKRKNIYSTLRLKCRFCPQSWSPISAPKQRHRIKKGGGSFSFEWGKP